MRKNWNTVPISELYEGLYDGPHATPKSSDVGPIFLGIRNVTDDGHLDLSDIRHIAEEDYVTWTRRVEPKPGDIVFTYEATLNRYAIIPQGFRGCLGRRMALIRTEPGKVDTRFLFYYFFAPAWREVIKKNMLAGATVDRIPLIAFPSFPVSVPPLPIQRRIAGILSAYDELIENSQQRIRILETIARALYREWFVHFRFPGHETHPRVPSPLGNIPKGWEVNKLGDLTAYLNRGLSPSYDENGDSMVINQKCVRDQRLSLEPARRQTKPIPPNKQVRFGDVLINSTGVGTLGRVAQVYQTLDSCTVDTHVTIARANSETDLDFFGCTLLAQQETFDRLGIGATGQTELSRTSIANVDLVVPPSRIQNRFGVIVRPIRMAAITHAKQIQNLSRTRDLLLPRLLSGQVELKTEAA
jgi:type I restriction enzyme S subunit